MYAVLYTRQLEPITVVDIPMFLWKRLSNGESINIAVVEMLDYRDLRTPGPPSMDRVRVVSVYGVRLRLHEHETLMLFTGDEESALLLQAEFLPGQRRELQGREQSAFARGFVRALNEFGG